jgi:hypothetical protein
MSVQLPVVITEIQERVEVLVVLYTCSETRVKSP